MARRQRQAPPQAPSRRQLSDLAKWLLARHILRVRQTTFPGCEDTNGRDSELLRRWWPDLPDTLEALTKWEESHVDDVAACNQADAQGPRPAAPLQTMSVAELLTTEWPEPTWIIPDILPTGLCILAGKAKIGKSFLALQVACAVTTRGKALGKDVDKSNFLYVALEDYPRRMFDRMRKQRWPVDWGSASSFIFARDFQKQIGQLHEGGVERLAEQIQHQGLTLVILDTLSRAAFEEDQNDPGSMTRLLSPLQIMAQEEQCCVMLVDHHKKETGFNPDPVTDILGSTGKGAVADTLWGLYRERGKRGAKLHIAGKDVEDAELALDWDPQAWCWQVAATTGHGVRLTEGQQGVVDAVTDLGASSCLEIAKATGRDKGNAFKILQNLVAQGVLTRTGKKYFLPCTGSVLEVEQP